MMRHTMMRAAWLAGLLALLGGGARAETIAIGGFEYADTSGEVRDQTAEHAARLGAFLQTLRSGLAVGGRSALVLPCVPACTARDSGVEAMVAGAREGGAALLVYGSVQKVSTLIQQASVRVVDTHDTHVLLDRMISFRGDTDEAWQHAARFIATSLRSGLEAK